MAKRKKKSSTKAKPKKPQSVSFDDFKVFLRSHLASCDLDGGVGSFPRFPQYELMPQDYLTYAIEAISNPTDANRINCVGHLKRAAECQADTFLHVLSLAKRSQTRNFPRKMETISKLGLIPSRSLTKLNTVRNKIEHEYAIPAIDDLELYFDLVAGFVAALEGAIFMMSSTLQMDFRPFSADGVTDLAFSIQYELDKPEIQCEMETKDSSWIYTVTPNDWDSFVGTLRVYFLLVRYAYIVSSDYVLQHL